MDDLAVRHNLVKCPQQSSNAGPLRGWLLVLRAATTTSCDMFKTCAGDTKQKLLIFLTSSSSRTLTSHT
jgi:hypothetical protein